MSTSMFQFSVGQMLQNLRQLKVILAKGREFAAEKKLEAGVLENARLAPDMFALRRQVHLTADFAKNSCARLANVYESAPKFDDTETTFEELETRVQKTIDYLETLKPEQFAGAEERRVVVPLRTRTLDVTGLEFLRRWTLPNFYFHLTTTYNILRHSGVPVGKQDFLGPV
jgi:uncharacterized protein